MFGCLVGQTRVYKGTKWSGEHSPLHVTGFLAHQASSPLLKGKLRHKRANGMPGSSKGMVERGFVPKTVRLRPGWDWGTKWRAWVVGSLNPSLLLCCVSL